MRAWLISQQLKRSEQIQVIPCCVDFQRFEGAQLSESKNDRFEVVYAGSLIGLYLVEEMGRFFSSVKALRPDAFLRILSMSPPKQGIEALRRAGVDDSDFEITAVPPDKVPSFLTQARLGVSFRKSTFAQIAALPTKIPEYLAAGLPVVCNSAIGDMDDLVGREQVGVVLQDFEETLYQQAAVQALALADDKSIRDRTKRVAHEYFDLDEVGGKRYVELYRRLLR